MAPGDDKFGCTDYSVSVPVYLLDAVLDPTNPLTAAAVGVYARMVTMHSQGNTRPSYRDIANGTGMGVSTVKRIVPMLRAVGALTWIRHRSNRRNECNEYVFAAREPFSFPPDSLASETTIGSIGVEQA